MSDSDFNDLSKDEQIARLEKLGRAALSEFGVEPSSPLESLVHAENTTFKVLSDQGSFCLRISRPGYQSYANIRSEIEFLGALSEADFRVPHPYQPRVVTAEAPGVPEPRNCVLFYWIDGEIPRADQTLHQISQVGELMARLHQFVQSWRRPPGFDRQNLDTWLLDPNEQMAVDTPSVMLEETDRQFLVGVIQEIREMAADLPRDEAWIRLIHSDLHHGNVVFKDGLAHAIDFDDTGFGFLLFDLSATLAVRAGKEGYDESEGAFLSGYARVSPLPPRTLELLPQFNKLRLATIANWVAGRSDNPEFREIGPKWVGGMCERMRAL